jgi:hypothetical protein
MRTDEYPPVYNSRQLISRHGEKAVGLNGFLSYLFFIHSIHRARESQIGLAESLRHFIRSGGPRVAALCSLFHELLPRCSPRRGLCGFPRNDGALAVR